LELLGLQAQRCFNWKWGSSSNINKNYFHKFKGVEIQNIPNEDGSINKFSIILIESDLTEIFSLFIEDILYKLIPVSNERDAITLINQRIKYWRKLFARVSGEMLSPEQQRGNIWRVICASKATKKRI
jgi:hypothetical protein